MALRVPNYLAAARIQDNTIRYEWDDWRTLEPLEVVDDELNVRLHGLSQRAVFAFMCGVAEWIYYRLAKLCDDPAPWAYMEAAWAMVVELRYCGYGSGTWWQEYELEGWEGPIKAPIARALERVEVAFQQLALAGNDPAMDEGALIAALAVYVMPDPAPYKRWCGEVLARFESMYPRDPEDPLGDVVPREAVDPECDFHVEQTERLINQFLASLDYRSSRFLSSPEGMLGSAELDEPFQGTPYVFDIEADRQARRRMKR